MALRRMPAGLFCFQINTLYVLMESNLLLTMFTQKGFIWDW
jgi:hypothetical protein